LSSSAIFPVDTLHLQGGWGSTAKVIGIGIYFERAGTTSSYKDLSLIVIIKEWR
jgi:hypothetical protein